MGGVLASGALQFQVLWLAGGGNEKLLSEKCSLPCLCVCVLQWPYSCKQCGWKKDRIVAANDLLYFSLLKESSPSLKESSY